MGHIFQSAKRPAPEMQCSGRGPRWTSQTSCTCAVQRLHGASRCQFVQRHCPSSMHGTNAKALQAREHAVGVTRQKCAVRNASTGQIHNWILVRANTHTHAQLTGGDRRQLRAMCMRDRAPGPGVWPHPANWRAALRCARCLATAAPNPPLKRARPAPKGRKVREFGKRTRRPCASLCP
jgi:hypothetical protein